MCGNPVGTMQLYPLAMRKCWIRNLFFLEPHQEAILLIWCAGRDTPTANYFGKLFFQLNYFFNYFFRQIIFSTIFFGKLFRQIIFSTSFFGKLFFQVPHQKAILLIWCAGRDTPKANYFFNYFFRQIIFSTIFFGKLFFQLNNFFNYFFQLFYSANYFGKLFFQVPHQKAIFLIW